MIYYKNPIKGGIELPGYEVSRTSNRLVLTSQLTGTPVSNRIFTV